MSADLHERLHTAVGEPGLTPSTSTTRGREAVDAGPDAGSQA